MGALIKNNIVGGEIMVKKYEKAFMTVISFSEEVIAASGKMEDGEVLTNENSGDIIQNRGRK